MKNSIVGNYTDATHYVACQEPQLQSMLKKIRALIQSTVPQAQECISYRIPCYKYHGMLVGFGARKNGCSFYAMTTALGDVFEKELAGITYSGSAIHIQPDKPLPVRLLKKIIVHRVQQNEQRAFLKNRAKASTIKKTTL